MKKRTVWSAPAALGPLFILTIAIHVVLFLKTDPYTRTHDVSGHLSYIRRVARGDLLPRAKACWQCYHPPIYYWIAAVTGKVLYAFDIRNVPRGLQLLSMVFFGGFLTFGLLTLRRLFKDPLLFFLGSIFLCLWPSGFFHAVRIGNDVLFYFFYAVTIWATVSWVQEDRPKFLTMAVIASSLSLFTKANGLMAMAMVASVACLHLFKKYENRNSGNQIVMSLGLCLVSVTFFMWLLRFRGSVLSNSHGLPGSHRLTNSWSHLLGFNTSLYFDPPFYGARLEFSGRQYFWIVLLKSALYGEWWSRSWVATTAASVVEILIFPLIGVCLVGVTAIRKHPDRLPLLLNAIFLVLALFIYRWKYPFGTTANFRYIYPAVISGAVFYVDGIGFLKERNWALLALGAQMFLCLFFVASTVSVLWF